MRNANIFFVLIILCENVFAQQNLVPNSGFEDITDASVCGCPTDISKCCRSCGQTATGFSIGVYDDQKTYWDKVANWTIPETDFCGQCILNLSCCVGSSDVYCNDPSTAHTGNSCARLTGPGHEYVTVQLLSPMKPYYNYHVEFFLFTTSTVNLEKFGIHFSVDKLKQCEGHEIEVSPQIVVNTTVTGQWFLVSGTNTPLNADKWITIGSFGEGESPFTYIDDVVVSEIGPGTSPCCPPYQLYEATDALPGHTHVENYIRAGNDAGIANVSGDVIVRNGQNVTFKAGNYIELLPGFSTDPGAIFVAEPQECNAATNPWDQEIKLFNVPQGLKKGCDWLCFNAPNATYYEITVFDQWGTSDEFNGSGNINSDPVCIWDGTGSNDETVFIVLKLNNCMYNKDTAFYLSIATCGSGKTNQTGQNNFNDTIYLNQALTNKGIKPEPQKTQSEISNPHSAIIISPNPTTGRTVIYFSPENITTPTARLEITDIIGKTVFVKNPFAQGVANYLDLSHLQKGIYFLKIYTDDEVRVEKVVIE